MRSNWEQRPLAQQRLLQEVVDRHCPRLAPMLPRLLSVPRPAATMTEAEREELINAIDSEFCDTGLADDDEPNARGLLLEELRKHFLMLGP